MSKVKMRCGRCGKTFSAPKGAKQIFCAECAAKERASRAAAKSTPTQPATASAPSAPKITGPGAGILDPRLAAAAASAAPSATGHPGAPHGAARQPDRAASPTGHGHERGPAPREDGAHSPSGHSHERAPKPKPAGAAQAKRPPSDGHQRPSSPRKPREAPPAFVLTDELRAKIEARYLELAQPIEFDGIRSQIASELHLPKVAVKRTVRELRDRMQLPSWWDLKAYRGSEADLERIRTAYLPLLPVPPIGVHKQMATELSLEPVVVYQGIRRIRAEMRLPQFNSPDAHEQNGHGRAPQQSAAAASSGAVGAS